MSDTDPPEPKPRPTSGSAPEGPRTLQIVLFCIKVGLMSFGGGLSGWLYREFVVRRGWMSEEEFASSQAFAKMMPGPNISNLLICCTGQMLPTYGVAACSLALFAGPFFAVVGLYLAFDLLSAYPAFEAASAGLVFAAIGMTLIICIRGVRATFDFPPGLGIIVVTAVLVGILHWPLVPVALGMAAVGIVLAWVRL